MKVAKIVIATILFLVIIVNKGICQKIICDSLYKIYYEEVSNDKLIINVEEIPEYEGGYEALGKYLKSRVIAYYKEESAVIRLYVDNKGSALCPKLDKGTSNAMLNQQLLTAAMEVKFKKPAMIAGKPVPCIITVKVKFENSTLKRKKKSFFEKW